MSIYPKVSGSISDAQVQAEPENRWSSERNAKTDFEHCRVATEEGKAKYSKQFALNKQAQKVKYVATDIVAEEPETPSGGGSNGGGGGNNGNGELEE